MALPMNRPEWVHGIMKIPKSKLSAGALSDKILEGWFLDRVFCIDGPREYDSDLYVLTHIPTGGMVRMRPCPAELFEMAALFVAECEDALLECEDAAHFQSEMGRRYEFLKSASVPPWVEAGEPEEA